MKTSCSRVRSAIAGCSRRLVVDRGGVAGILAALKIEYSTVVGRRVDQVVDHGSAYADLVQITEFQCL